MALLVVKYMVYTVHQVQLVTNILIVHCTVQKILYFRFVLRLSIRMSHNHNINKTVLKKEMLTKLNIQVLHEVYL